MPVPAVIIIVAVVSYFIGSIPFGYITVRVLKGIDVRTVGSKNVGATNVMRVAGKAIGFSVLAADILKGVVAVLVVGGLSGPLMAGGEISDALRTGFAIAAGAGAITGHVFTVFLRFKGGKGVATGLGVVLSIMPIAGIVALAAFIVIVAVTRYVSLGSCLAAVILVITQICFNADPFGAGASVTVFSAIVAMVVLLRHTANIKRLLAGSENKLSFSSKKENEK